MNHNPYRPPSSQISLDQDNIKQKTVRLKWITFMLLLLIGLPSLFIIVYSIFFILPGDAESTPFIPAASDFFIPAAVVCYCVSQGLRNLFSERSQDYQQLLYGTFSTTLLGIFTLLSFIFIAFFMG